MFFRLVRSLPVILLVCTAFFVSTFAQSPEQKIDDLLKRSPADTATITSVIEVARDLKENDPAKALKYLEKAYISAEKLQHAYGILNSVQLIGDLYSTIGDVHKGIKFIDGAISKHQGLLSKEEIAALYIAKAALHNDASEPQRALEIFNLALESVKKPNLKARLFANRGNSYQAMGEYRLALKDYQAALDIYLQLGQLKYATITYTNLGLIYYNLSEFAKSLEFYKKGLALAEEFKDPSLLSQSYSNIGATYEKLDSLETAISYYMKGLEIAKTQGDQLKMAQNFLNLGNIYSRQKKHSKAQEYLKKSLDICRMNGIIYGLMMNHTSLGELYFDMGDLGQSISNYDSAMVYARQMSLPNELIQIGFGLAGAHEKAGNFKEALTLYKDAVKLKDSIFAFEKQKVILDLTSKYENEKKEKQIADQQFTITLYVVALISIALLLGSGLAFLYYRHRRLKLLYLQNIRELYQVYPHIEATVDNTGSPTTEKELETGDLFNKIIDHLQEDRPWMDPEFNINDLARNLSTNRTYISTAIAKGAGVNFHSLISSYRVNEAKKLIIAAGSGSINMDDVMSHCGFRNRGTFNIAFNRQTGMTPSQFKNFSRQNPSPETEE